MSKTNIVRQANILSEALVDDFTFFGFASRDTYDEAVRLVLEKESTGYHDLKGTEGEIRQQYEAVMYLNGLCNQLAILGQVSS